jgi:hypothetical protein
MEESTKFGHFSVSIARNLLDIGDLKIIKSELIFTRNKRLENESGIVSMVLRQIDRDYIPLFRRSIVQAKLKKVNPNCARFVNRNLSLFRSLVDEVIHEDNNMDRGFSVTTVQSLIVSDLNGVAISVLGRGRWEMIAVDYDRIVGSIRDTREGPG